LYEVTWTRKPVPLHGAFQGKVLFGAFFQPRQDRSFRKVGAEKKEKKKSHFYYTEEIDIY